MLGALLHDSHLSGNFNTAKRAPIRPILITGLDINRINIIVSILVPTE